MIQMMHIHRQISIQNLHINAQKSITKILPCFIVSSFKAFSKLFFPLIVRGDNNTACRKMYP